jgi:hypothetical protein
LESAQGYPKTRAGSEKVTQFDEDFALATAAAPKADKPAAVPGWERLRLGDAHLATLYCDKMRTEYHSWERLLLSWVN